jgi:formylmethanofuran dehydrogenase subunit E
MVTDQYQGSWKVNTPSSHCEQERINNLSTITRLAAWDLGPAYYQNHAETNPECFVCSEPINEEQHCEGCGEGVCSSHTHRINHQSYCQWCASDVRNGRG